MGSDWSHGRIEFAMVPKWIGRTPMSFRLLSSGNGVARRIQEGESVIHPEVARRVRTCGQVKGELVQV